MNSSLAVISSSSLFDLIDCVLLLSKGASREISRFPCWLQNISSFRPDLCLLTSFYTGTVLFGQYKPQEGNCWLLGWMAYEDLQGNEAPLMLQLDQAASCTRSFCPFLLQIHQLPPDVPWALLSCLRKIHAESIFHKLTGSALVFTAIIRNEQKKCLAEWGLSKTKLHI